MCQSTQQSLRPLECARAGNLQVASRPADPTSPSASPGWAGRALSFITLMARGALAGVWFWAGWAKILDPVASAESVRAHRILSEAQISSFVYGLPALELVLAALLWAGLSIRLAAVMSALLLLAFLATIVVAWGSGRSIGCGCFGHGGEIDATDAHYLQEVLRDVGLLFLCAWLTKWPASNFSVDADLR